MGSELSSVGPEQGMSRRGVLSGGMGLLASFGLAALAPDRAAASPSVSAAAGSTDLALFRPVAVSSTEWAATPSEFAADGLALVGVKGSGWRAGSSAQGPQWIYVDLQVSCEIQHVRLTFEAKPGDGPFPYTNSRDKTAGSEILSSYATAFELAVNDKDPKDETSWKTVYNTKTASGGVMDIPITPTARGRWVRLKGTGLSNGNPLGLNGFQVYGTSLAPQPAASGWTDFSVPAGFVPRPLTVAADGTVPVESDWVLTMEDKVGDADGAALSGPSVDISHWLPATVPGTVLASLVEQRKLPDPAYGRNNLHVPEALSRRAWWYRRTFTLPSGLDASAGRRIWLEFDGVNHQADVWLNGTGVGRLVHPFGRRAWDVTAALHRSGDQVVAVKISPIPRPGSPGDHGPSGQSYAKAGATMLEASPTYLAASGWDWMPAVRDRASGIWSHVRLRSTGDIVVGDARVDTVLPNLPDTRSALVTITVPFRNASSSAQKTTVTASFGNVSVSSTVTVAAGQESHVVFAPSAFPQLHLANPALWWPNGYGDPALHELTVTAKVGGTVSDHRTVTFGIRQIQCEYGPPIQVSHGRVSQTITFPRRQARYVRMLGHTRATGFGFSLWRFSVHDSTAPGGTDLAKGKSATALSDDGNPASNAVDGNEWTRWSSAYKDDQWIQVDLGSAVFFDTVVLEWEDAYAATCKIQVSSNGGDWPDAASVDNTAHPLQPLKGSGQQTLTFPPQRARYVRMLGETRATGWGFSLWEFAVRDSAKPDSGDLAKGKSATALSDDGNLAPNAVDGDPHTRWSSAYKNDQWIQVDLGETVTFDQVDLAWEMACAASFKIQVYSDNRWIDVASGTAGGKPLTFVVNGVEVFCRGGNWGWDELLRRMPASRMDAVIRMHRDMNFTMIRNWIGSSYREELFATCDKYGILVWNEFWDAFSEDPPNRDDYLAQATDTVLRYRAHPCVAIWAGCNEGSPPADLDGKLAAIVADNTDMLYVSNSTGFPITGDGPYKWLDPRQYFTRGKAGFWSEIGLPTVPVVESMRNLLGPDDKDWPQWPIGGGWYLHNWSEHGNQQPSTYKNAIDARLGESNSLDDFCRKAQFVNYESMRAIFEAWNARLWNDATGVLLWMSHPAWHCTVWQTYDYDLDVNGSYYGARKGCEAHHVQANLNNWQVTAINHTTTALTAVTVTAQLYDLNGKPHGTTPTRKQQLDVARSSTEPAFTVPFDSSLDALHLLRLTMTDAHGTVLSENTYWRYRTDTAMRALNELAGTKLSISLTRAGTDTYTATVTNKGATVAPMVRLSLRQGNGTERVLPTLYSDNYLWLLPGEGRTVTVTALRPVTSPRIRVEAYNAPATLS